jgi:hypothetical protein
MNFFFDFKIKKIILVPVTACRRRIDRLWTMADGVLSTLQCFCSTDFNGIKKNCNSSEVLEFIHCACETTRNVGDIFSRSKNQSVSVPTTEGGRGNAHDTIYFHCVHAFQCSADSARELFRSATFRKRVTIVEDRYHDGHSRQKKKDVNDEFEK